MYYIVLDLEWNQSTNKKDSDPFPFEIIEIGAVKLNHKKEIIDSFSETIKPVIHKEIHHIIREITSFSTKDFENSRGFKEVISDFISWCGDDCVYCTWGSTDLTELQRNMTYHGIPLFKPPVFYYDIQKIFSILYDDRKIRRSLIYAIEFLDIIKDKDFHRALLDAIYTAKVIKKIDNDDAIIDNYSIDTYQVPLRKKDEIYVKFNDYTKYISRLFESKTDALEDKTVLETRCILCHKKTRKKIRWFSSNAKIYYSVSKCPEHGLLKSKLRMKKHDSGDYFIVKTTKLTDESGIEILKRKQYDIRKKRREKRNKSDKKISPLDKLN